MQKVINKIINNCGECPYKRFSTDYDMEIGVGRYECLNEDSSELVILEDNREQDIFQIPIPEWCGLKDAEIQEINLEDKQLLETYMWGFNDELDGRERMWNPNPLLLRAYEIGRGDAIIGDDIPSNDLQTNEEILNKIKAN